MNVVDLVAPAEYVAGVAVSASETAGPEQADLQIEIGLGDADPADVDAATGRLRNELLELDVDRVQRASAGEAPPGTRAAELVALGGLVVTLARNSDKIAAVVRTLQGWLARDSGRTVKLELDGDSIEVSGVSSADQERLIAAFIERHGSG
jgi:hypothetical protein